MSSLSLHAGAGMARGGRASWRERAAFVRPLGKPADDAAGGSLEQKRQESVNECRAGGHEEPRGEPDGERHMAEIGLVDRCRVVGEELRESCSHRFSPMRQAPRCAAMENISRL